MNFPTYTKMVKCSDLSDEHVLVGRSGGLSAVYDVAPCNRAGMMDLLAVETEHGFLYLEPNEMFEVLA